ncbi:sigma 54-interacting transcriptional regulator [Candidatus Sumerlaeota bacterium]|nr:sigma 54-interacting transcriptional regulator [Candidatus Sumerlaeota bacterium]
MSERLPGSEGLSADAAHPPVASERMHRDGIRAFCEGDYAEALRLFSQAALINPSNLEFRKDMGHAHLHLGQIEDAQRLYRSAWDDGARVVDLAFNLALLDLDQGQAAEASGMLRSVVEQDFTIRPGRFYLGLLFPSTSLFMAECCLYLGISSRERGRIPRAIEHLQRAVELNPRLHSAHQLLAECHLAEKRWDRAIERCRELLDLLPTGEELATVRITMATALFESGQVQEAVRELQQVLDRDPDNEDAQYHLTRLEERLGEGTSLRRRGQVDSAEVASPLFGLTSEAPEGTAIGHRGLTIIGQSQAMRRVMRHARLAAASNSTVLLTGENGTGKELIARAIYHFSPRRDKPLIAVNCAALPETLLESELFGHEKGAFTGAEAQKKGRFELADGGTLFLDEVGEMSLATQVKLLRVLQEREFTRVGGTETIVVDVRIIAATNQDLQEAIRVGRFREDLYFRLNVLPIVIPPLRERREDIPLLVEHIMRRHRGAGRAIAPRLSREEMEILMDHSWPGNIRELENFLERAIVMGHSGQQLIEEIRKLRRRETTRHEEDTAFAVLGDLSLAEVERAYILHVLDQTGGSQRQAAEILGINPSTLWRRMKRYESPEPEGD